MVLTNRAAEKSSASWGLVRGGAAILVSAMTFTSAYGGGIGTLNCVGGRGSFGCVGQWGLSSDPNVRTVPKAHGYEEKAQAAARERRWMAKCDPVIERDHFGVARFHHAARGCEYGIGED